MSILKIFPRRPPLRRLRVSLHMWKLNRYQKTVVTKSGCMKPWNRYIAPLGHALKTFGKSYMPSDDKVLSTNLVLMESNLVFGPIFPDSTNVKYFSKLSKDQADRGSLKRRNIHHSHLGHHIRTVQHASKHNCINSVWTRVGQNCSEFIFAKNPHSVVKFGLGSSHKIFCCFFGEIFNMMFKNFRVNILSYLIGDKFHISVQFLTRALKK